MSTIGSSAGGFAATALDAAAQPSGAGSLQRKISWTGAFWAASGVPALVLFSIGSIAATVGKPAYVIWIASILMGFLQAFVYAEIAGLFPNKSGGASVFGAVAWVRHSKFIAPISVWCNWFAWSPVLAIGGHGHITQRPGVRRADLAGVCVPTLCAGQRTLSAIHGSRPSTGRIGGKRCGNSSVRCAGRGHRPCLVHPFNCRFTLGAVLGGKAGDPPRGATRKQ